MNHSPAAPHRADPFDPSASSRLKRAGILLDDGTPDIDVITTLASSFGALLYDELCDSATNFERVLSVQQGFQSALERGGTKRKLYIAICLQYDYLQKPLPDVIWWMAGCDKAVSLFVDAFIDHFSVCCTSLPTKGGDP
ncbi:hypothetical protein RFF05_14310 [Bengtsoniella intestinalis]|uniref:hypothetical protein n=1 Tax=Bengtsoniella intestinalis TaxID=3073143 RepID=UPI00391F9F23